MMAALRPHLYNGNRSNPRRPADWLIMVWHSLVVRRVSVCCHRSSPKNSCGHALLRHEFMCGPGASDWLARAPGKGSFRITDSCPWRIKRRPCPFLELTSLTAVGSVSLPGQIHFLRPARPSITLCQDECGMKRELSCERRVYFREAPHGPALREARLGPRRRRWKRSDRPEPNA